MQIGRLRKRVQILEAQAVMGAFGGETIEYVPVTTVWGGFAPLEMGSGEREHSSQQVGVSQVRVTLRYPGRSPNSLLNSKHRLLMNGRYFEIVDIYNIDERNRELTVSCREVSLPDA